MIMQADLYEDRAKKLEEEVRRMINNKDTKLLTTPERPERHVTVQFTTCPYNIAYCPYKVYFTQIYIAFCPYPETNFSSENESKNYSYNF